MKNLWKIDARKSDGKNPENHQNWSRKGGQNRETTSQKYMWKKDQKKVVRTTLARGTPVSPEHSLSKISCGVGYMKVNKKKEHNLLRTKEKGERDKKGRVQKTPRDGLMHASCARGPGADILGPRVPRSSGENASPGSVARFPGA